MIMLSTLRKRNNQKGFTLVELLVVISIIGILAAIAVPKLSGSTETANATKVQADVRTISTAVLLYKANPANSTATDVTLDGLVSANLLASKPVAPGTSSYTIIYSTGEVTCTYAGKVYSSYGTVTTVPTTPPS